MTYELEWEEPGELCPQCGGPIRTRDCETCHGEGEIDLYEEDAVNFAPGEMEVCDDCNGVGLETWCPKCGDIVEITCPTCGGSTYIPDPKGNGVDDFLRCPDCEFGQVVKIIPFPKQCDS